VTLRVAIVDDEKPARDRLKRLLAAMPDVALVGEAGDVASAVELIDRERPELCLLDVQIPGGDGFEVLRLVEHLPQVVFTTAFDHYAVRAFEVNSLDYLLKPVHRERLQNAVHRAQQARERGTGGVDAGTMQRLLEKQMGAPLAQQPSIQRRDFLADAARFTLRGVPPRPPRRAVLLVCRRHLPG